MEKRMVRLYTSAGRVCYVDPKPVNLVEEIQNERTRIHFSNNGDPLMVDVRGDADSVYHELFGSQLKPAPTEEEEAISREARRIRTELTDNVAFKTHEVVDAQNRLTEDPLASKLLSVDYDQEDQWITVEAAIQKAKAEGADTFSVVGAIWIARGGKAKLTHARRVYFRRAGCANDILIQNW